MNKLATNVSQSPNLVGSFARVLPEVSLVHAFVRQNFVADFTFDPPRRRQRRFLNGHPLHFYPLGNWSGEGLVNDRYSVNFITA